jgi:hypothetical protein
MSKRTNNSAILITERDLNRFFSCDAYGDRLTLGDYIQLHEGGAVVESLGEAAMKSASEDTPRFSDRDIEILVGQYLDSMSEEDEVLEIVGSGSFTADELREEVRKRTAVGEDLIAMILADHTFVEERIKRGCA